MWGLFMAGLFVGTLRLSVALRFVFGTPAVLFFMLAVGHTFAAGDGFRRVTGDEGTACGLSACHAGLALVLNDVCGRTVMPPGVVRR